MCWWASGPISGRKGCNILAGLPASGCQAGPGPAGAGAEPAQLEKVAQVPTVEAGGKRL